MIAASSRPPLTMPSLCLTTNRRPPRSRLQHHSGKWWLRGPSSPRSTGGRNRILTRTLMRMVNFEATLHKKSLHHVGCLCPIPCDELTTSRWLSTLSSRNARSAFGSFPISILKIHYLSLFDMGSSDIMTKTAPVEANTTPQQAQQPSRRQQQNPLRQMEQLQPIQEQQENWHDRSMEDNVFEPPHSPEIQQRPDIQERPASPEVQQQMTPPRQDSSPSPHLGGQDLQPPAAAGALQFGGAHSAQAPVAVRRKRRQRSSADDQEPIRRSSRNKRPPAVQ